MLVCLGLQEFRCMYETLNLTVQVMCLGNGISVG
jgi:hypothetical protein